MAEAFRKRQPKQSDQRPFQYNQAVESSIRRPPLGYVVNSHNIKWTYRFDEDMKTFNPLLDSLEGALSKPLFCCGGSLRPPNMDKFVLKLKREDKENWEEFELSNLPPEELLEYCNPAPFGDLKEMKTAFDSEVRLASEIESERFIIEREHVFKTTSRMIADFPGSGLIEEYIEDTLTPGRSVRLDRYKLNVYSKGGFFRPHVDTPSGHDMIGTLVLCLPSTHKGGELCINHDGLQHVFDFSQESSDSNRVQWAAFYSDCIHEVKPVLDGQRVTVTYKITSTNSDYHKQRSDRSDKVDDEGIQERFEASTESPSLTAKALAEVNSELEKIFHQGKSSPSRIGFFLKHKYVSKGLESDLLKGEDKILFDSLVEKQWKCRLMSVLSRYQTSAIYPDGPFEERELDESHKVYEFNPLLTTPFYDPFSDVPRETWPWGVRTDYSRWRIGVPFIDIYRRQQNDEQLVRNNEGEGSWLGNEIEDVGVDKIYLDSAVIVELDDKP